MRLGQIGIQFDGLGERRHLVHAFAERAEGQAEFAPGQGFFKRDRSRLLQDLRRIATSGFRGRRVSIRVQFAGGRQGRW